MTPEIKVTSNKGQYEQRAKEIRRYLQMSKQDEVHGMRKILELERMEVLWKHKADRFRDIIKQEGWCTISKWEAFKKVIADKELYQASELGVPALCFIAKHSRRRQRKLVLFGMKFIKDHGVPPATQFYQGIVNKERQQPPKIQTELQYWKQHARYLEQLCKSNRISFNIGRWP